MYINLESIYDISKIYEILLKNSQPENFKISKNFFELWESEQTKYLKYMLLIFSISHIIMVSSPSCEFDISIIRFFRIIDIIRNKMLPTVVDLLKSLDLPISKDWIYAGRPCSPRVLFLFENCPKEVLNESTNKPNVY